MYIYIRSMSEAQTKIYDKLTDASDQILIHLFKILLFNDTEYVNHWKQEIYNFLHKVDKLKGRNKWPKVSFIQKALSTHNDMLPQYRKLALGEERSLTPRRIDQELLDEQIIEYIRWASEELSNNGILERDAVYNKIDELINNTL